MSGVDALSALLVALFLLCLRFGPAPRLYATMFLLSLAMELWGTWLGNWQWQAHAPWLGWATMNPPFAAGAFYCVLDMLVGLLAGRGPVTDIARPPILSPPPASGQPRRRANSRGRVGEGGAGLAGQPKQGHDVRPITLEARAWKPVSV